jgi:hypothetical protein
MPRSPVIGAAWAVAAKSENAAAHNKVLGFWKFMSAVYCTQSLKLILKRVMAIFMPAVDSLIKPVRWNDMHLFA